VSSEGAPPLIPYRLTFAVAAFAVYAWSPSEDTTSRHAAPWPFDSTDVIGSIVPSATTS
jgi:hypothetical protein